MAHNSLSPPSHFHPPAAAHIAFLISLLGYPTDLWNHVSALLKERIKTLKLDISDPCSFVWQSHPRLSPKELSHLAEQYYPPEACPDDTFQIHVKQDNESIEAWIDLEMDAATVVLRYEEGRWLFHDLRIGVSAAQRTSETTLQDPDMYWEKYSDSHSAQDGSKVHKAHKASKVSKIDAVHLELKQLAKMGKELGLTQDQFMALSLSAWLLSKESEQSD